MTRVVEMNEPKSTPRAMTADRRGEAELVQQIRAGDEAACATFVREHGNHLLAVARRFLRCEADCADAVQDAFVAAFKGIGEFSGDSKLSTWLHRIVVNVCLMRLRSQRSRPTTSINELLPQFDDTGHHVREPRSWSESPTAALASMELRRQVRAAIDQLPDSYRTVLLMRDIEGMDTELTAEMLGLTATNVKVRLHRARQALRTLLEPIVSGLSAVA